jgi:2-oxoisovalerate dehydrogenase E2 component (dihydrolipoyl transacylase)
VTENQVKISDSWTMAMRLSFRTACRLSSSFSLTRGLVSSRFAQQQRVPSTTMWLQQFRCFASGGSGRDAKGRVEFILADIGEGITECEVMEWKIKPGDFVKEFELIAVIQSDKATVEIPSRYEGVVEELCYEVGELAQVGSPLIYMAADTVVADDHAPSSPDIKEAEIVSAPASQATASVGPTEAVRNGKVLCSPAVRRVAREMGVDLGSPGLHGSGPKGRLLKEDIELFASGNMPPPPAAAAPSASAPPISMVPQASAPVSSGVALSQAPVDIRNYAYLTEDQNVAIKGLQRTMVKTMEAANAVPTLVYCEEVEMDSLIATRAALLPSANNFGLKLSFLPFIIKATSMTLMHYPSLNAHTTADCTSVIHRASHNIGIAMDTPRGLMVPNIKDVQNLSILQIAAELARLAALGRDAKLGREDLTGGTFTLSNIGTIGGTYASPILVVPEVVIGALGKTSTVPRYDEQMNLVPKKVMTVSWSADHRVVEGATIARFVRDWKGYMENPASMLLFSR